MTAIISQYFTTNKANYDLLNDSSIILEEIQKKGNQFFGLKDEAHINASWSILLDAENTNGVLINEDTVPQQFMSGVYIGGNQSLKHLTIVDNAVSGILTLNLE